MAQKRKRQDIHQSSSRKRGRVDIRTRTHCTTVRKAFTHSPIEFGGERIRLLKILPAETKRGLSFSIDDYFLVAAPSFTTISYTWGSKEDGLEQITVNNRNLVVWKNCFQALQQALLQWRQNQLQSDYLWIDAICVNQNFVKEKEDQVSIMGDIFAQATDVLACVGPHADDSEFLYAKALETVDFAHDSSCCNLAADVCEICLPRWGRWASDFDIASCKRLYKAREAFCNRRYWQRVWIIQEVAKAQRLSILCGDDKLSFTTLWNLERFLSIHISQIKSVATKFELLSMHEHSLMSRVLDQKQNGTISIDEVFYFTTSRCSDRRDHLYGLLRLIKWPENAKSISPDYTISEFDLALKVGQYLQLDTIPRMLRLFHIGQCDYSLHCLARNRRSNRQDHETQISGPTERVFKPLYSHECRGNLCGWVETDSSGNLTASLVKKSTKDCEQSCQCFTSKKIQALAKSLMVTTTSNVPAERRPKRLMLDSEIAGVACSETQAGDLLVSLPVRSPYETFLVLRPSSGTGFDIVGQALLLADFKLLDPRKLRRNRAEASVFSANVELKLSVEEAILLYAPEICGHIHNFLTMRLYTTVATDPRLAARVIKHS